MIKTPLSTMIGGAFWTPKATIVGSASKTFDQIIKSLFANGEQGFAYDPNDLGTMFQDAAGTIPVTGAGQPVGLILDKSKGLMLGSNLATTTSVIGTGIGGTEFKTVTVSTALETGFWYKITINVSNYSGSGDVGVTVSLTAFPPSVIPIGVTGSRSSNGLISFIALAQTSNTVLLYTRSSNNADLTNITIQKISGNHAYQTQAAMRPLLVASPQRLDYDIADDKPITTLPAQLTGCIVIRSVPNVGTQILTGQTIPATHNDNTDHCGLIVINRALTASETSQITKLFNKAAGV